MDAAVALHADSGAVRRQRHVVVAGGLLLGLGALTLWSDSWRLGALLMIGALLGVSHNMSDPGAFAVAGAEE